MTPLAAFAVTAILPYPIMGSAFAAPPMEAPPAYIRAARGENIPASVLFSVALQESGRQIGGQLRPWPWTLNVAGEPRFFGERGEACRELRRALAITPATRVDVGIAQINVGYHGHRVTEPCLLLNPYRNLALAARILREQHVPGEDWLITIGRYHRPAGGEPAARYRRSVEAHHVRVFGTALAGASAGTLQ